MQNLVTTSEAARILKVADGTVRQMARRGALVPAVQTEGRYGVRLFDRAVVEDLARRRALERDGHEAA